VVVASSLKVSFDQMEAPVLEIMDTSVKILNCSSKYMAYDTFLSEDEVQTNAGNQRDNKTYLFNRITSWIQ
jgi:hypothetical protein